ncbi:MAG: O-antigen ligase family protein [Rhodospirillales bacterium]
MRLAAATARTMPAARPGRLPSLDLRLRLMWLALCTAPVVYIEPSPYDVLIAGLSVGFFILGMRIPERLGPPLGLLALFLVGTAVAVVLSPNPEFTGPYFGIKIYLAMSFVFFAALVYENPERVLPVLWSAWSIAAAIAVLLAIAGYYGLWPSMRDELLAAGRAKGLFKDPNVYGPFVIPVAVYVLSRLDSGSFMLKTAFLGFLSFGILLSFSRGAWFNFGVTLVVFMALRLATYRSADRMIRMLLVTALVGLMMAAGFLYAISTPEIAGLFAERAKVVQYYDVGQGGRFFTQRLALDRILADPIGIGPGNSFRVFGLEPHNHYLHVPVECGWLAAIAYFSFVGLTAWRGLQTCLAKSPVQGAQIVAFASVVGTLAESFIIDSDHWRHVFVLYAIVWGTALWVQGTPTAVRGRQSGSH